MPAASARAVASSAGHRVAVSGGRVDDPQRLDDLAPVEQAPRPWRPTRRAAPRSSCAADPGAPSAPPRASSSRRHGARGGDDGAKVAQPHRGSRVLHGGGAVLPRRERGERAAGRRRSSRIVSGAIVGRPWASAARFCSSIAWRTAGRPPRSSCSATGSCSGRSVGEQRVAVRVETASSCGRRASRRRRAVRAPVAARSRRRAPRSRRLARGTAVRAALRDRSPRAAARDRLGARRASGDPTARRVAARHAAEARSRSFGAPRTARRRGRRGRRVGPSRRRPRPFGASVTWTPASARGGPMTARSPRRAGRAARAPCAGTIDSTSTPSRPDSTSARSTSPIVALDGTSVASSVPRGSRAPAARHVNRPSSSLLVSSISMRRATARNLAVRVRTS